MKIIHAPLDLAGQVGLICEFLNKNGVHATGYNYMSSYFNYKSKVIQTDLFELQKIFEPALHFYDIFHFHNSNSFMSSHRDLAMIAQHGKKMIMHHRGNDVRSIQFATKGLGYENPYVNTDGSFPHETIIHNLEQYAKWMSAAIVQDYELYHYVIDFYRAEGKKVYVLPRLIDTNKVKAVYVEGEKKDYPLVVHAPTNPEFKGTAFVEKAIEALQKEIPFHYQRVENMSHKEALSWYEKADVVIDQILCGAYGNLSVEAMALGKPVICYIRPDLWSYYPANLPIQSANPDTLYDVLKPFLLHWELRYVLGVQGRKYVEDYHEATKVIPQLIKIYKDVLES